LSAVSNAENCPIGQVYSHIAHRRIWSWIVSISRKLREAPFTVFAAIPGMPVDLRWEHYHRSVARIMPRFWCKAAYLPATLEAKAFA